MDPLRGEVRIARPAHEVSEHRLDVAVVEAPEVLGIAGQQQIVVVGSAVEKILDLPAQSWVIRID